MENLFSDDIKVYFTVLFNQIEQFYFSFSSEKHESFTNFSQKI